MMHFSAIIPNYGTEVKVMDHVRSQRISLSLQRQFCYNILCHVNQEVMASSGWKKKKSSSCQKVWHIKVRILPTAKVNQGENLIILFVLPSFLSSTLHCSTEDCVTNLCKEAARCEDLAEANQATFEASGQGKKDNCQWPSQENGH